MDDLPGWGNAAAVVLSCAGPLRRHQAALVPLDGLVLPQVLLGAESQLLAFAAAARGLAGRLFFAPFPEMFPDAASLRAAWRRVGGSPPPSSVTLDPVPPHGTGRLMHLRFGGVRAARVLKGVRNGCVLAESGAVPPLTASHHPFASGSVLPAAVSRLFLYRMAGRAHAAECRPRSVDGAVIPAARLSPNCVTADLLAAHPEMGAEADLEVSGLDLVSLAEFRSSAWAMGPVRPRGSRPLAEATEPAVLLPWNMDHPGSIVPDLLIRLARLHGGRDAARSMPRVVLMPFNYLGQTGIIRQLISRLREAAHDPDSLLAELFLARVGHLGALPALRRIAPCAWVDGNDPEHWWTLARFSACGITSVLIDPRDAAAPPAATTPGVTSLQADEAIWVEAETRCGTLTFPARLPSLRTLPRLMALTEACGGSPGRPARRKPRDAAASGRMQHVPMPA